MPGVKSGRVETCAESATGSQEPIARCHALLKPLEAYERSCIAKKALRIGGLCGQSPTYFAENFC